MTMNRFQLSFLGLLISLVALRISSAALEKDGECPPERYVASNFIPNEFCQDDDGCPGGQKCCRDNNYKICKPPASDRCGPCPVSPTSSVRCNDMCTADSDCATEAKCCLNSCGHNCLPLIEEKPGFCEMEKLAQCVVAQRDFCVNDTGCPDAEKCCPYGCAKRCQQPLDERSGKCPTAPTDSEDTETSTDLCSSDYDCEYPKKCCQTLSGKDCTNPWAESK
ncbi:WAP four-disulfide core domain protein 3 [Dendrobates tinctorius]|uniref:WAP four-disulfide core domain protein 3 n=1 Tax=Dendrobates tinctorius TaxID=92724 RepID=UPI003CC9EB33